MHLNHSITLGAAIFMAGISRMPLPAQQTQRDKIDLSKLGPQVGQQVPDFGLKDQDGNTRNLKSIMGPKGSMLVFVRSADW